MRKVREKDKKLLLSYQPLSLCDHKKNLSPAHPLNHWKFQENGRIVKKQFPSNLDSYLINSFWYGGKKIEELSCIALDGTAMTNEEPITFLAMNHWATQFPTFKIQLAVTDLL